MTSNESQFYDPTGPGGGRAGILHPTVGSRALQAGLRTMLARSEEFLRVCQKVAAGTIRKEGEFGFRPLLAESEVWLALRHVGVAHSPELERDLRAFCHRTQSLVPDSNGLISGSDPAPYLIDVITFVDTTSRLLSTSMRPQSGSGPPDVRPQPPSYPPTSQGPVAATAASASSSSHPARSRPVSRLMRSASLLWPSARQFFPARAAATFPAKAPDVIQALRAAGLQLG